MDYISKYSEFIKSKLDVKRPIKIVCDASNGTAGIVLEKLLGIPNVEFILINTKPDPDFPAHGPNPLLQGATDMLGQKVLETGADLGVAFDGDADRAFFVDNEGKLLPSYITAAIWFSNCPPPFVADELAYLSLTTSGIIDEKNISAARVGAVFIKEKMTETNSKIGVEFSGHFYFGEIFNIDSGIMSMVYTLNILSKQNKSLAQLHKDFSRQALVNENITLKKTNWTQVREAVIEKTSSITKNMVEREGLSLTTENGWINVRPSQTEPLMRITVGAKTKELADKDMNFVSGIIKEIDEK